MRKKCHEEYDVFWVCCSDKKGLRAFEAIARCGSYVEAARELKVTDAALRQHVRTLESHFASPLFRRDGRGILATPLGVELAAGLSDGFTRIQSTIERLTRDHRERPIRVALTPAFAENWLIPRLPEFWSKHPNIQIDLAPSIKPVDLSHGEYDLAIRYGNGDWLDYSLQMIASAEYTVVASPILRKYKSVATVRSLKNAVWLFEESREEHQQWAKKHGLDFKAARNKFYPNNSLVLSAVRAGHGVSLQSRALIETDLATGGLVVLFNEASTQLGYYALYQKELRNDTMIFLDWISSTSLQGRDIL